MKLPSLALLCSAVASMAAADPGADTCRLLEIAGRNKVSEVEPVLNELAARWSREGRENAIRTLKTLLREVRFSGGNAYVVGTLGEDYQDHVLAIRIQGGELAAARLSYEWTPDGMHLTVMKFSRRMSESFPAGGLANGTLIDCK